MNSHEPGQNHSDEHGYKSKGVVLLSDDFVVETEDVLPDEALGRSVMLSLLNHSL
jgi:hypothetical protein